MCVIRNIVHWLFKNGRTIFVPWFIVKIWEICFTNLIGPIINRLPVSVPNSQYGSINGKVSPVGRVENLHPPSPKKKNAKKLF